jgi:hypothetical protein
MTKSRWDDKRDANEDGIVKAFQEFHALVIKMPRSAGYDLQIHFGGFSLPPVEVKNPATYWKLTNSEMALKAECEKRGIEFIIIMHPAEVPDIINKYKRKGE